MEEKRAERLRLLMREMEPYFASGDLLLLHVNYGYLAFTTKGLHRRYGHAGNGQWGEVKDLFYFTISFDGEDKDTLEKKGTDLELWCYGDKQRREEASSLYQGEGLGILYSKKGFDLIYRENWAPLKEKASEVEEDTKRMEGCLQSFLKQRLPRLEALLLKR